MIKTTLHWVPAARAATAEVRLYDYLLREQDSSEGEGADARAQLNAGSLEVPENCFVEPVLAHAAPGSRFQFERLGYFCVDPDAAGGKPVFNRTVTLRDEWAKIEKGGRAGKG